MPQDTASLRAARKRLSRELAAADRADILKRAHRMIKSGQPRFVAYELVQYHPETMQSITRAEVEQLGAGMKHWAEIDTFACYVAGQAWRDGRIPNTAIRDWARSDDWCWRRAALVSTVPLNSRAQGGTGDPTRTLAVCKLLVADRHDLVVKALSWALRELSKRDPASVRQFLAQHRDALAARVLREVTHKLTTGLKNPRR